MHILTCDAPIVKSAAVELFPESYIDDAFADTRAKLADLQRLIAADLNDDQWSDEYADEQAGLALAESQIESGLMAW